MWGTGWVTPSLKGMEGYGGVGDFPSGEVDFFSRRGPSYGYGVTLAPLFSANLGYSVYGSTEGFLGEEQSSAKENPKESTRDNLGVGV